MPLLASELLTLMRESTPLLPLRYIQLREQSYFLRLWTPDSGDKKTAPDGWVDGLKQIRTPDMQIAVSNLRILPKLTSGKPNTR